MRSTLALVLKRREKIYFYLKNPMILKISPEFALKNALHFEALVEHER
jgi:hypothetical protein